MKKSLLFIVICICILIVGCTKPSQNIQTTDNEISGTQIYDKMKNGEIYFQSNSQNLEDIAKGVMDNYLNEFKKDNVSKESQITDYSIDKISDIEGDINNFNFYVVYSEKPNDINSYVLAGNGEAVNNWIKHKSYFVNVKKVDNKYVLINTATGK
jgi:Phosphoprotein.